MRYVLQPDSPNAEMAKPPNVGPVEKNGFRGPMGGWSSPGGGGRAAGKTERIHFVWGQDYLLSLFTCQDSFPHGEQNKYIYKTSIY